MRKKLVVEITAEGRDLGKVFLITEMPAIQAEKWAARAFLAMSRANVELPDGMAEMGLVGLAIVGLQKMGGVKFEEIEPLLDEMLQCVQVCPDPHNPEVVRPFGFDGDFEEIATLIQLRMEIFELHSGFTLADARSRLAATSAFL